MRRAVVFAAFVASWGCARPARVKETRPKKKEPAPPAAETAPAPTKKPPPPPFCETVRLSREGYVGGWLGGRMESVDAARKRWGPWLQYQAILWSSPPSDEYVGRYFELGLNAGMAYRGNSPERFYKAGLNAYLENVFRSPYFYLKKGRGDIPNWKKVRAAYAKDRSDKSLLVRKPCLNDPEMRKLEERFIRETSVAPFLKFAKKPIAIDLRDEPSVTQSANPFDYCFSGHCLKRFRERLKETYGTLDELNSAWETSFASWDAVQPLTTDEIRAREYPKWDSMGRVNFSPWADHREFMDETFAECTRHFVEYVKQLYPEAYVGLEGLQMPHAFGGYDYWKLSRVMNWMEPYDIRCNREIVRSFAPDIPLVATGFETSSRKLLTKLWYLALMGDRGIIIWPFDNKMKDRVIDRDAGGWPLTETGKELSRAFRSIRDGASDVIPLCERAYSPIGIYYSQASIRADWMLETRHDKGTWIRRFSSYEAKHNQMARAREATGKLIEDCGYQYIYVSYEQVAKGELEDLGIKLLLAPRLHAVSEAEVKGLRKFVEGGGHLYTDLLPGIMDEHCRMRDVRLCSLLGLGYPQRLKWEFKPREVEIALPGASLKANTFSWPLSDSAHEAEESGGNFEEWKTGKGKCVTCSRDLFFAYESARTTGEGKKLRSWFLSLARDAGIEAPLRVVDATGERPVGVETFLFRGPAMDVLALGCNARYLISEELVDLADKSGLEPPVRLKVELPYEGFVYDAGRKGLLGRVTEAEVEVRPERPAVLVLLGYEVEGVDAAVKLEGRKLRVSGRVVRKEPGGDWAPHVVHVAMMRGDEEYPVGNILAEEGRFDSSLELPQGAEGEQIVVREVASRSEKKLPLHGE